MLTRPRYSMPEFMRLALEGSKLLNLYKARPAYQQNDYIAWITRAKQETTRQKRLQQMLQELKQGNVYMKMLWSPKKFLKNK